MTVRFLLDEHFTPAISDQLKERSIDAEAVASRPDLRTRPDPDILEAAATEERALVTRNVGDYIQLDASWAATGRRHSGILCVSTRRYSENASLIGTLTAALADWATTGRDISGTHWFL